MKFICIFLFIGVLGIIGCHKDEVSQKDEVPQIVFLTKPEVSFGDTVMINYDLQQKNIDSVCLFLNAELIQTHKDILPFNFVENRHLSTFELRIVAYNDGSVIAYNDQAFTLQANKKLGEFIDKEGTKFKTVIVGNQEWFLSVGNYLTFSEASSFCPEGAHLPSDKEWKELELYLGIHKEDLDSFGVRKLSNGILPHKEIDKDVTGLNFELNGLMVDVGDTRVETWYIGEDEYGQFWTATKIEDSTAIYRSISKGEEAIERLQGSLYDSKKYDAGRWAFPRHKSVKCIVD